VTVGDEIIGQIEAGLVVLLGLSRTDTEQDARYIVGKTVNLRVFPDDEGRFDRSPLDVGAGLLIISQFTLYGDTRKGRRPSFSEAAPPEQAEPLFNRTLELYRESGLAVETGRFQAHMIVAIHNDGPVTILLDSADLERPRRGRASSTPRTEPSELRLRRAQRGDQTPRPPAAI
jgi:D-tyrosyl-tRNA(Tyr) deacylase